MLQFDLQFYEELTVAWVRTVKFISGAFFWPTGQLVFSSAVIDCHGTLKTSKYLAKVPSFPFRVEQSGSNR